MCPTSRTGRKARRDGSKKRKRVSMVNRPNVTGHVRWLWWRFALLVLVLLSLGSASQLSISRTYGTTTPGLLAWGDNGNGQVGNGTTINSYTPVPISNLTGVTA